MHLLCLTLIAIITPLACAFDINAHNNTVVYYGQGYFQKDLLYYCQQPTIDLIVLSFVELFPAQANGFLGTNFGNQCLGTAYPGPGYHGVRDSSCNDLQNSCPALVRDIPVCQAVYGKKIILSLGGGVLTYQLNGAADGASLASQLFFMFGPRNLAWVAKHLPRPFDLPGQAVEVDGFDLDIEHASADNSQGYIELVTRLRALFRFATKPYLLTGSPQCVVPDANMGPMIAAVKFDVLLIQFYNTAACSASAWASAVPPSDGGFSFDHWSAWLVDTPSKNARLFIGLPGSPDAANPGFYVAPHDVQRLVATYACRPYFGGVALWKATYADNNRLNGEPFYQVVKDILNGALSC